MDTLTLFLFFIMLAGIIVSTIAFALTKNKRDHNLEYLLVVLFFIAMFILPAAFIRQYDNEGYDDSLDRYSEKIVDSTILAIVFFVIAAISIMIYAVGRSDDSSFKKGATNQIRKNKAKRKKAKETQKKKTAPKGKPKK